MYYAVAKGHNIGIYNFWNDCKDQVLGFKGAIYKKFSTEKEAENYILNYNTSGSEFYENIYEKFYDSEVEYFVYTDGSCKNNGKINAIAGIGIFFEKNDKRNVSKIIKGKNIHTNNSAELIAIITAYEIIKDDINKGKKICIVTDSDYSIRCIRSYGEKCDKDNWSKNIPNKDLVFEIYNLYKNKDNVKFKHIKSHTNNTDIHSIGNRNADLLAYNAI